MELLRLAKAAERLGVHPVTLRLWADSGKIPVTWVGRESRFSSVDVEAMKVTAGGGDRIRLAGRYVRGYVRGSGSTGQEASVEAQEAELRAAATGGGGWPKLLFAVHGATLEVPHPRQAGGRQELVEDFICLVTTFAGRLYGMRSTDARRKLLAESGQRPQGNAA